MKAAILIPARFASSRYPGKPLVDLKGAGGQPKPLIQRSHEAALRVPGDHAVYIVTDDERIRAAALGFGADVIMTSETCRNGTDRCAAALEHRPFMAVRSQFPGGGDADDAGAPDREFH